jgi:hypothetical protein
MLSVGISSQPQLHRLRLGIPSVLPHGALSALEIFIFLIIARCIRKKKLSGAAEEEKAV